MGQATQGYTNRAAESLLSKFPGSAGVLANKGRQQGAEIGSGVERIAATLAPKATAEQAGRSILRGIKGEGGFIERTKQASNQLYAKLDEAIPPQSRIEVRNTQKALADLNAPIPGAPNVSKQFQNARLIGIEKGLAADAGGEAAVLTRPGVRADVDMLRKGLLKDRVEAEARNAQRASLGLKNPEPVPTLEQVDAQVSEYLSGMVDNRLPYEALKKLRTIVGAELEGASLVADVPRSKWKAVYAALSKDLEAAAGSSPDAKQAWSRANTYFNYRMKRIDAIEHVVDKNGGPEAVFNAAFSGTKDGATTLRAVMQSLPKEGQKELSAAFVRRLGKAVNSQQDEAGDVFSTQTFLSNWNKVSPEAKKVLLDRHGMAFSRDMDKIARVASNLREGSQVYANPSGSGVALQ